MSYQWYKKGRELLEEIEKTYLPEELLSLWYIGQMGMIVKWKEKVLCLDPVLGGYAGRRWKGSEKLSHSLPAGRAEGRLCILYS